MSLTAKLVKYPHPSLRYPARPITTIDRGLRLLAGRMLEIMYENRGLGLAGPQVAAPIHIIVMNFEGDHTQKEQECVAINPVIVDRSGSQDGNEGCLSFPELFQDVRRAKKVTVRAYDLEGKQFEMECTDLPSRLWQHEIDHLHGQLFIDKMSPVGKLGSREMLKEFEREFRGSQKRGATPSDAELLKELASWTMPDPGPIL